jgi:CheY-like chemotaxis protein
VTALTDTGRDPVSRSGRLRWAHLAACASGGDGRLRHSSPVAVYSSDRRDGDGPPAPATAVRHRDPWDRPRVIVVEDDPLVRCEVAALLDDEGIEVAGEADDGEAGVALATKVFPDVVLMDLRMPRMGGIEAMRLITRALPDTQVILLSAYDDLGLRLGGRQAGAHAYLIKGCPGGLIVDAVYDAWNFKRGLDQHEQQR